MILRLIFETWFCHPNPKMKVFFIWTATWTATETSGVKGIYEMFEKRVQEIYSQQAVLTLYFLKFKPLCSRR